MPVAQKIRCQVGAITDHGDHVYTLVLVPERPAPRFRPGQFLHLAIDPYDPSGFWPDSRAFSIASPPADRTRLTLTYSVQGHFTRRMERELAVGQEVWVKLPYGEFTVGGGCGVVLFAGGTGITAFTAFLENLEPGFPRPVTLFYGARQARLLVYRPLVERLTAVAPGFHPFFFVEQDVSEALPTGPIPVIPGRLSVAATWDLIPDALSSDFYISGPPAMIAAISQDLRRQGLPADQIRVDAWE